MSLRPPTSIPPLSAPLSDGTITLRLGEERDIPEILVAHDNDSKLHANRGLRRPPSGAELGRSLEEAPSRRAAGTDEELTIVAGPTADGEFLGQVIIHSIEWEDRRAALGVWLTTAARGRGAGRRALQLTAQWLFDAWGMERIALHTAPDNTAMLACATAAGFEREGVLRDYHYNGRAREDEVALALLSGAAPEAPGAPSP